MPSAPAPTADLTVDPGAARRAALIDGLAYLIDEAAMLGRVLPRVPDEIQTGRPLEGVLTFRETLARLAERDGRRLTTLEATFAEDVPRADDADGPPDALANDAAPADLLDRLTHARRALVAFLERLPPDAWARTATFPNAPRTVYAQVEHAVEADTDLLRSLAERLYDVQGPRR